VATIGGRPASDVNGYIKNLSLQDAYKFSLGVRRPLKVQPSQRALPDRKRLVILNKAHRLNFFAKGSVAPDLLEIASNVFKSFGND
jgi:hypothetical protein